MSRKRQKKILFLIGEKKSPGENSKRNLLTSKLSHINLLHSDKSTYFYKGKLLSKFLAPARYSTNDGRWASYGRIAGQARNLLFVLPVCALLGLVGYIVNPVGFTSSGEAYAETITNNVTDYASISFSISNSEKGELDNNENGSTVSAEVIPGTVSYIDNTINITTKSINKFYVVVQSIQGGSDSLVGKDNGSTIAPLDKVSIPGSDGSGFSDNSWGYAITNDVTASDSALSYQPLPIYSTSPNAAYTSPANLIDGNYDLKLTFAAKINATKPSDNYQAQAMVSVVADPKNRGPEYDSTQLTDPFPGGFVYMQDERLTPEYCANLADGTTGQLVDGRDGSIYWVTVLKDGYCWMTQNLDLKLDDITLTDDNSELAGSDLPINTTWTPKNIANSRLLSNTTGKWSTSKFGWENNNSYIQSYDPGIFTFTNGGGVPSSGQTELVLKDVSAMDRHYLIGDYYSWPAATAGQATGITVANFDTTQSICPAGWKLPLSGSSDSLDANAQLGSFGLMLYQQEISNNVTGGTSVLQDPLYFVRGGNAYSNGLNVTTYSGYYWSAKSNSDTRAYNASFGSSNVSPATSDNRYFGFSVRCVVR